jgi:hypothetical protein
VPTNPEGAQRSREAGVLTARFIRFHGAFRKTVGGSVHAGVQTRHGPRRLRVHPLFHFGRISQNPDFRAHPAWRANVDKDFFAQCCFRHKLLAVEQTLFPWSSGEVIMQDLDCTSLIYKSSVWLGPY